MSLQRRQNAVGAEVERYRTLVEGVKDYAIFLLNPDGYIETWNAGAERLKGYRPNQIIGKHFSIFYPDYDVRAKKPERELELARKFGRIEDEDWRIRSDGTRFWANVVITALYDRDGQLMGYGKVTRDLTERKAQESELRDANLLLRRQQNQLETLNRAKDDFVSLASHQLRTPATGVKQYLGLLLEGFAGELSDLQREYILKAFECNERQIATVNDLLQVAQMDAGKITLKKEPVELVSLLQSIIEEQSSMFAKRGQRLDFDPPEEPTVAIVDAERLRMVIQNILDNASKYTPSGGKVIMRVVPEAHDIQICISDSGVGIKKEDIPLLFHRFTRIPNRLSKQVGGSGLGLYWAHKIIKMHKGEIDVDSTLGEGSTFKVCLPSGVEGA